MTLKNLSNEIDESLMNTIISIYVGMVRKELFPINEDIIDTNIDEFCKKNNTILISSVHANNKIAIDKAIKTLSNWEGMVDKNKCLASLNDKLGTITKSSANSNNTECNQNANDEEVKKEVITSVVDEFKKTFGNILKNIGIFKGTVEKKGEKNVGSLQVLDAITKYITPQFTDSIERLKKLTVNPQ